MSRYDSPYDPASAPRNLEHVVYEKKGHVAYLTINRPEVRNALHSYAYAEMRSCWRDISLDPAIYVGIVTGAGQAFCAGRDVKFLAQYQKAMLDLLLTGRKISAAEALRLGILTRAVPADQLAGELDRVLEDIFRGSAGAIRRSKLFVRECETLTYQQGIVAATDKSIQGVGLPDMRKGIDAFLDKQKAKPRGP